MHAHQKNNKMEMDIVARVGLIDDRLGDVENILYPNERTREAGLIQGQRDLAVQVTRLVFAMWGLMGITLILLLIVALVVLG